MLGSGYYFQPMLPRFVSDRVCLYSVQYITSVRPAPLSVQCYAMHGQNINLPMCVSVCPSHFLLTRLQVRPLNRDFVGGLVSYGGKTIPRWRTAAILKIVISSHLGKKSSDFHEILYTAADFELGERHVIKHEKVALDRLRVRQNIFLVVPSFTLSKNCGI